MRMGDYEHFSENVDKLYSLSKGQISKEVIEEILVHANYDLKSAENCLIPSENSKDFHSLVESYDSASRSFLLKLLTGKILENVNSFWKAKRYLNDFYLHFEGNLEKIIQLVGTNVYNERVLEVLLTYYPSIDFTLNLLLSIKDSVKENKPNGSGLKMENTMKPTTTTTMNPGISYDINEKIRLFYRDIVLFLYTELNPLNVVDFFQGETNVSIYKLISIDGIHIISSKSSLNSSRRNSKIEIHNDNSIASRIGSRRRDRPSRYSNGGEEQEEVGSSIKNQISQSHSNQVTPIDHSHLRNTLSYISSYPSINAQCRIFLLNVHDAIIKNNSSILDYISSKTSVRFLRDLEMEIFNLELDEGVLFSISIYNFIKLCHKTNSSKLYYTDDYLYIKNSCRLIENLIRRRYFDMTISSKIKTPNDRYFRYSRGSSISPCSLCHIKQESTVSYFCEKCNFSFCSLCITKCLSMGISGGEPQLKNTNLTQYLLDRPKRGGPREKTIKCFTPGCHADMSLSSLSKLCHPGVLEFLKNEEQFVSIDKDNYLYCSICESQWPSGRGGHDWQCLICLENWCKECHSRDHGEKPCYIAIEEECAGLNSVTIRCQNCSVLIYSPIVPDECNRVLCRCGEVVFCKVCQCQFLRNLKEDNDAYFNHFCACRSDNNISNENKCKSCSKCSIISFDENLTDVIEANYLKTFKPPTLEEMMKNIHFLPGDNWSEIFDFFKLDRNIDCEQKIVEGQGIIENIAKARAAVAKKTGAIVPTVLPGVDMGNRMRSTRAKKEEEVKTEEVKEEQVKEEQVKEEQSDEETEGSNVDACSMEEVDTE